MRAINFFLIYIESYTPRGNEMVCLLPQENVLFYVMHVPRENHLCLFVSIFRTVALCKVKKKVSRINLASVSNI